jgi:hypothetical protein
MKKALAFFLVALAACRGREPQKSDSALTADLALAAQVQAARPISFQDSAPPAASAPAPAPTPQPRRVATRVENAPRVRVTPRAPVVTQPVQQQPEPVASSSQAPVGNQQSSIGAGASFSLASSQRICTTANRPGDRFVATVTNTVTGSNGATIPAGSSVVLEVASVTEPSSGSNGSIAFSVNSVELNGRNYPLNGEVASGGELERVRIPNNSNSDRNKVLGGAAIGAVMGHIMGKSTKGTVIGAAAGAATGAVAAKMSEKYETCLPVGAPMRVTLHSALLM